MVREINRLRAVFLSLQPSLSRLQLIEALAEHGDVGLGLRFIKAHDDVASIHIVVIAHVDLADDASGRVLNFLDV